jgi:hypothetical protein
VHTDRHRRSGQQRVVGRERQVEDLAKLSG